MQVFSFNHRFELSEFCVRHILNITTPFLACFYLNYLLSLVTWEYDASFALAKFSPSKSHTHMMDVVCVLKSPGSFVRPLVETHITDAP
jgi:hypothetical protein